MTRISDVFGGNFLDQEDIGNARPVCTIENWESVTFPAKDGKPEQTKLVLSFLGKSKRLVVGVQNAAKLEESLGELEQWVGKQVIIYVDHEVMFGKKKTGGLRAMVPGASPIQVLPPPAPEPSTLPGDDLIDF